MDGSARSGTSGRTRSTGLVLESAYARQRLAILHSLQVTSYAGSTAATEQSVTGNADCRIKWKPRLCISDGWAARRSPVAARGTCGVPLESRTKCSAVHAGRLHLLAHAHTACSSRQKSAWPQKNEGSGYRLPPKRRKRCRAKGDLRCARRSLCANTVRVQQDGMSGGAPLSADQLHCCSAGVGHTDTIGEFELFLFRPRTTEACHDTAGY